MEVRRVYAENPITFVLDVSNAGPGNLTCQCQAQNGDNTVIHVSEGDNGEYIVELKPSEAGLHTLNITWDGQSIPGSPIRMRVIQPPDARKVIAHGHGLNSGLIEEFRGVFMVETKGAGPGGLEVRIHGPKGAFKVGFVLFYIRLYVPLKNSSMCRFY